MSLVEGRGLVVREVVFRDEVVVGLDPAMPGEYRATYYWREPRTVTLEFSIEGVSADSVALLLGIPLVDASIDWEPHLVRGTQ